MTSPTEIGVSQPTMAKPSISSTSCRANLLATSAQFLRHIFLHGLEKPSKTGYPEKISTWTGPGSSEPIEKMEANLWCFYRKSRSNSYVVLLEIIFVVKTVLLILHKLDPLGFNDGARSSDMQSPRESHIDWWKFDHDWWIMFHQPWMFHIREA